MAGLHFKGFGGIAPRKSIQFLPDNGAQTAENCRLLAGRLEPHRELVDEGTSIASNAISAFLWRYETEAPADIELWLNWATDVDVVRGPIADDQLNRIYYTEAGVLKARAYDARTSSDRSDAGATFNRNYYLTNARTIGIPLASAPTLSSAWKLNPSTITASISVQLTFFGGGPGEEGNLGTTTLTTASPLVGSLYEQEYDDDGNLVLTFSFPGYTFNETVRRDGQYVTTDVGTDSDLVVDAFGTLDNYGDTLSLTEEIDSEQVEYGIITYEKATRNDFNVDWNRTDTTVGIYPVSLWSRPSIDPFKMKYTLPIQYAQGTEEYRVYVQTWVDDWGQEGPPSAASAEITVEPGKKLILTMGAVNSSYNITRRRLYRAASGASGENDYFFVAEIEADGTDTYTDSKRDADLAEVMPQFENPPGFDDPNLTGGLGDDDYDYNADLECQGLVSMPGGILAAFYKKNVFFSEPYLPFSWPTDYRLTMDFDVVGLAVSGNELIVLTEGHPYLIAGSHPEMMTVTRLMLNQSCVAKRGICNIREVVCYPSPDGLVFITAGGSAKLATDAYYSRREWQAIDPSTMFAESHDGRIHAWTYNGATYDGYIFDFDEGVSAVTTTNAQAKGVYSDLENDVLYLLYDGDLKEWDADESNNMTLTWKSKQFTATRTTNFRVARVRADSYPAGEIKLRIFAGGVQVGGDLTITDARAFRLPTVADDATWVSNREWEIEIESTVGIDEILVVERQIVEISERRIQIQTDSDTDTWLAKEFSIPSRSAPNCARVDAEEYPVTLKIYVDGTLEHTATVADDKAFRLPQLTNGRLWEIDAILDTDDDLENLDIFEVILATSMRALR